MTPVFEIHTVVSEGNYRRAMIKNGFLPVHLFLISGGLFFALYYMAKFFYYTLSPYYRVTTGYVVSVWASIIFFMFLVILELRIPKRNAQRNIDHLIMRTGKSCLITEFKFYDNEFVCNAYDSDNEVHMPYYFITRIQDFGNFVVLRSRQGKLALITKSDIPDNKAFSEFIWSKCPTAKFKEY